MRFRTLSLLVLAAGLASTAGAHAQVQPFGQGFDGWVFTATTEKPGVVNCRATRKVGGREDIIAMRNDHKPYLSVNAEGRKGKFPGTIVNIPGKPRNVYEWKVPGEANGIRMWFVMDPSMVSEIAAVGTYLFSLPDSEDTGTVPLGKRAADAWERVNQCVNANGG